MIEAERSFGYRTVAALLGHEQEYRAADLSAQGLAAPQTPAWPASANRSQDFPRRRARSALGYGPVPGLGWQGRLVEPGAGDRLQHASVAWLAPVSNRQGQYRTGRVGADANHPLRQAGSNACALSAVLGQQIGIHKRRLHTIGTQLRPPAGVHHARLPTEQRDGGTGDPNAAGAMCVSASL